MSSGATAMFPSAHTAGRTACGAFPVLPCAIEDSREKVYSLKSVVRRVLARMRREFGPTKQEGNQW